MEIERRYCSKARIFPNWLRCWRLDFRNYNTLQRRYNAVVGSHEHWPRYTWSALYVVRVIRNMTTTRTTAVSSSYYGILHIACMLYCMFLFYLFIIYLFIYFFFFIVETLCMYLAWFPFYSFNPVNNKFFKLKLFCFLLWSFKGTNCNSLALWITV